MREPRSTQPTFATGRTLPISSPRLAPDVIFHLAAQAIVLTSYQVAAETFDVNVMGTVSLLEAVRALARPAR